ncbi:MAG: TATA-box-binding protein [Promethearchaeota archaeon Loki_b31]|nr:MAG: TATA-box-binding protein [Candidatus Lokiarchaeota archaeon Loki_b31]
MVKEVKEIEEEEEEEEKEEKEVEGVKEVEDDEEFNDEADKAEGIDYKIENVVATVVVEITEKIDLNIIARKHADVEYNPERFPGLVMRILKPKATILIFSTGKMVVTGMRKASEADRVVEKVLKNIRKAGIKVSNPEITIQNIVASGDLHTNIDLNMAAIVMEYAMYEPEVFPGLIYRMQEPKTVFLIFSTGRIVCTGAKKKEIVREAVKKLNKEVRDLGVAKKDLGNPDYQDITFI